TTALMPVCIIASWLPIQKRVKEYMVAFLVLETLMVGTFGALDLVVFYLFFEGGLIPMFLIIGVWCGPRRAYASFKFFLYTLIAHPSVVHMGFVPMGIFAATTQGVAGGIFQMICHGVVSAALFLCVGVVYDRMHTREIAAYGGLVNRMPLYAAAFMVFTLANV